MHLLRSSSARTSKAGLSPLLLPAAWAMDSGAPLSHPAEVHVAIALGACGALWTLGILLFVILFLTNRGRAEHFLQGQPWLWELTHVVAWIWAFHLGLTANLLWVWHRLQGLDPSQRTHWIDRLSWTSLTFLPIVPFAAVVTVSAVLLIKGQVSFQLSIRAKRLQNWEDVSPEKTGGRGEQSAGSDLSWEEASGDSKAETSDREIRDAGKT